MSPVTIAADFYFSQECVGRGAVWRLVKPLLPALESPPGGEPRGNFAQNRISDHIEVGGGRGGC